MDHVHVLLLVKGKYLGYHTSGEVNSELLVLDFFLGDQGVRFKLLGLFFNLGLLAFLLGLDTANLVLREHSDGVVGVLMDVVVVEDFTDVLVLIIIDVSGTTGMVIEEFGDIIDNILVDNMDSVGVFVAVGLVFLLRGKNKVRDRKSVV